MEGEFAADIKHIGIGERDMTPESPKPQILDVGGGVNLAYRHSPGASPGVVFLTGFKSDMEGGKALALETHCRARGQAFTRFDYRGHGESSHAFEDGTIGKWAADAVAIIDRVTEGPQILVGSSMGGWIMLLAALARPERVAGLVGIAAAPDFTEDAMWAGFTDDQRRAVMADGRIDLPSRYTEAPYIVTRRLIEDGRRHLVLRAPLALPFPVRLLHGTADPDVAPEVAWRLLRHIDCADARLTLIKDADHRLSDAAALGLLGAVLDEITVAAEAAAP